MKHQPINFILSAELIVEKPHYIPDRRRQVAQPAQPTLPSNYWWPYPSLTWTTPATVPVTTVVPPTASSPTAMSSTSTKDILSSSTPSSLSTTSIDPQQTNPPSHSQLSVPIIASIIAGVVVVVVFGLGVLILFCWTRRRREHTTRRTWRRRGDAEKGWRHVPIVKSGSRRSWWNTLFSSRGEEGEEVIPGPRYVGVDDAVEGDGAGHREGRLQDELLLAEKPRRPKLSLAYQSSRSAELCDDDDDDDDDDREQVPWESLRHKSIKRAILAKVDEERKWTDSMRGVRAANANAGVGRRQTHTRCDSDFWLSSSGFRIVAESPPPLPSFPFFSGTGDEEDRYTPAPTRMKSSRSITSPLRVMRPAGAVQALLRSPPTVMSPEMESALCFTPVLSDLSECVENATRHSGPGLTSPGSGQERMQGQRSRDAAGTALTRTYRMRTDRALRRVEAIVESGWTERGVASRIGRESTTYNN